MGTPEDVAAEKYFTPPTLTGMLKELWHYEDIAPAKRIFKEWLKTVDLPHYHSFDRDGNAFNATESIQHLIIQLVDEP